MARLVTGATYHAAGPITQWTGYVYDGIHNFTESRQYNANTQLTRITSSLQDTEYVFSGSQNNGRILQTVNHTSGETVNYTYDSLNRLLTAGSTSGSWGESFTYDGFGNLTDKTVTAGSAPALHITVNPANNRVDSLYNYDANGNVTSAKDNTFSAQYDALNRITQGTSSSNGTDLYGYTPDNNRWWKQEPTTLNDGEIHFFGAFGEDLASFQITGPDQYNVFRLSQTATNLNFAGRLVYRMKNGVTTAVQDRLGSIGSYSYYPYGEEYTSTQQDQQKFATYYRDATTVLDYARNRHYSSTLGRFMTADPYRASGGPADPGSWNRYVYTGNDPVNFNDQAGLDGNGCSGGCYYWQTPPSHVPGDQPGDLQPWEPPAEAPIAPNPGPPPVSGGGGGVPDYTAILHRQVVDAIRNLDPRCKTAITDQHIDLQKVSNVASQTTYYTTYQFGSVEVRDITGYVNPLDPSQTLNDYLGSARAAVLFTATGGVSNDVVLGQKFFTQGAFGQGLVASQNTTLIHEALHTFTGLNDVQLYNALGLGYISTSAPGASARASNGISSWLSNGCPPIL